MGNALKEKGAHREALLCYQTAVAISPQFAAAHSNLSSLLKEVQPPDHLLSIAHSLEAIRIDPNFADAYSNLGNAYRELGQSDAAIHYYHTALRLNPNSADVHAHLGSTFKDLGRLPDAVAYYRKALALKPSQHEALCELVHTNEFIADWSERDQGLAMLEATLDAHLAAGLTPSVQPFHAFMYDTLPIEKIRRLSEAYARRAEVAAAALRPPKFAHPAADAALATAGEGRLKVGYVSSDFGNHPLSHLMQSIFGFHDKSAFDVYCYAIRPSDGSVHRKKIEGSGVRFADVTYLDSTSIASRIAADGIHLLIDLNGFTRGSRLEIFAMRPAPIQLMYMGFPGTSGAKYIDYLVTDRVTSPPELAHVYTEALLWMPHSYFVNDHRQALNGPHCGILPPEMVTQHWADAATHPPLAPFSWYEAHAPESLSPREVLRHKYGLPPFAFVYCCFNQLYKLDPPTFRSWAAVLREVPNSVLWLLRFPALAVPHITAAAAAEGLAPERIFWSDVTDKAAYIARASLADAFLDTPTCNGHTTGTDVLWAGLPVITSPRQSMASRVAASLCHAVGCPEMVADDMEAYVRLAVRLGVDRGYHLSLRRKLWENRLTTPLFDTRLWTKNWEESLRAVWVRHCDGLSPANVDTPPLADAVVADAEAENAADAARRFAENSKAPPGCLAGLQPLMPSSSAQPLPPAQHAPSALPPQQPPTMGAQPMPIPPPGANPVIYVHPSMPHPPAFGGFGGVGANGTLPAAQPAGAPASR